MQIVYHVAVFADFIAILIVLHARIFLERMFVSIVIFNVIIIKIAYILISAAPRSIYVHCSDLTKSQFLQLGAFDREFYCSKCLRFFPFQA